MKEKKFWNGNLSRRKDEKNLSAVKDKKSQRPWLQKEDVF
jgi:hypothetical protein